MLKDDTSARATLLQLSLNATKWHSELRLFSLLSRSPAVNFCEIVDYDRMRNGKREREQKCVGTG